MQNPIQILKSICYDNKYTNWYLSIIKNSNKQNLYQEKHHIIPDCLFLNRKRKGPKGFLPGNPNHKNNISYLTPKEHFIVHMLLPKMLIDKYYAFNLSAALNKMKNNTKYYNSRSYQTARKINSNYNSNKTPKARINTSKRFKKFFQTKIGKQFLKNKSELQKISLLGSNNPAFNKPSGFKNKHHSIDFINKLKNKTNTNHHKYKTNPTNKKFLIKNIDRTEIIYSTIKQFCIDNNINYKSLMSAHYKNKLYKGWSFEPIKLPIAILIDPNDIKYEVYNIKEFCKLHNLYYQCIISVLSKTKLQYKGWSGYKINREL